MVTGAAPNGAPPKVTGTGAGSGARARLVDVASRAGVSKSVASRALAGAPDIAGATKLRVKHAAEALGYHPSRRARLLGRRNGGRPVQAVAGLVSLHVPPEVLGASFLGPVLAGILSGAAEEGLELQHIVERAEDGPAAEVLAKLVAEDRADGLILLTFLPLTPADVAPLDRAHIPYVLVNRHFGKQPVNCVTLQWEAAAHDAVLRLGRLGHTRMALLLPDLENTSVVDRAKGWQSGVKELGLDEKDAPILRYHGSPGVPEEMLAGGRQLAEQLFASGLPGASATSAAPGSSRGSRRKATKTPRIPTAIVGFNDWCALGVLRVADERDVKVPEHLSVIGFDSTCVADGTTPPLCSYSPRFIDLGREAARLLATALRTPLPSPQRIDIPVDFTCRASCGPAPTNPPSPAR